MSNFLKFAKSFVQSIPTTIYQKYANELEKLYVQSSLLQISTEENGTIQRNTDWPSGRPDQSWLEKSLQSYSEAEV